MPGGFGFNRPRVDAKEVSRFHEGDDVDSSAGAHHHTIGEKENQAASGAKVKKLRTDFDTFSGDFLGTLTEHVAALSRANRLRNPDFRVNQRGYVSGAALPPQQYGPDGWCASGLVNLIRNPTLTNNSTDWVFNTGTASRPLTGGVDNGPHARLQLTGASTDPYVVVFASGAALVRGGVPITISAWVRTNAAGRTMRLRVVGIDAAGSGIGAATFLASTAVSSGVWTRLVATWTPPTNAVRLSVGASKDRKSVV